MRLRCRQHESEASCDALLYEHGIDFAFRTIFFYARECGDARRFVAPRWRGVAVWTYSGRPDRAQGAEAKNNMLLSAWSRLDALGEISARLLGSG
jgi:hypothetical protein